MTYENGMELEVLTEDISTITSNNGNVLEVKDNEPTNLITDGDNIIEIIQPDPLILSRLYCDGPASTGSNGEGGGSGTVFPDTPHTGTYGGFRTTRGFTKVELSWIEFNVPSNAKYTAIWRSESSDSNLAVLIGSSNVPTFVDTVNPGSSYYYWIQGVTHNGQTTELHGPVFCDVSQDQQAVLTFLGLAELNQELTDLEQRMRDLVASTRTDLLSEIESALALFQSQLDSFVDLFNTNLATLRQSLEGMINSAISRVESDIAYLLTENLNRISAINALGNELASETQTREEQIADLQLQINALNNTIDTRVNDLSETLTTDIATLTATIINERTIRITETSALAQTIDTLTATVSSDIADTRAQVTEINTAFATLDSAIAQRILTLEATVTTSDSAVRSLIEQESTARATLSEALATQITTLTANVTTDNATTNARITEESTVRSDETSALATKFDTLEATFNGNDAATNARIDNEITTRSDADAALAQQLLSLSTRFEGDISDVESAINVERIARTNADSALAAQVTALQTDYVSAEARLNSRITEELTSIVTANSAFAETLLELESTVETRFGTVSSDIENRFTTITTEYDAIASAFLDLSASFSNTQESLNQTNASITSESTARADADSALATQIINLDSEFKGLLDTAEAGINTELTILTNKDLARATQITNLESEFTTLLNNSVATINDQITTLTDADSALAISITNLRTEWTGLLSDTEANFNSQINVLSNENQSRITEITNLTAQIEGAEGNAVAQANNYTNAQVGYCVIGGAVSDHTDKTSCEANGGSWLRLPLANALDMVSISYTDAEGTTITGSAGSLFESIADDLGNVSSRAWLGVDVNGRVTGVNVTGSGGSTNTSSIDAIANRFSISHPDTLDKVFFFNTTERVAYFKGKLILNDGTTVDSVGDIQGETGPQGPAGESGTSAIVGTWNHTNGFSAVRAPNGGAWDMSVGQDNESHFTFEQDGTVLSSGTVKWELWSLNGAINVHNVLSNLTGQSVSIEVLNDETRRVSVKLTHVPSGSTLHQDFFSVVGGSQGATGPSGTNGQDGTDGISAVFGAWDHTAGFAAIKYEDGSFNPPFGQYNDSNYTFYRGNQVISTGTIKWGVYRTSGDINTYVPTQSGEHVTYQLINDESQRVTVIVTHTASGAKISQDFYTISNGVKGSVGPGFYTIVNSTGNFPASSTATSDFLSNLGQAPKANDHLTYTNSARTNSSTKRYDGTNWVAPTLLVNGDILALGTITGQHIAAGTINAGHIAASTIDTHHLSANAVNASKIDVNDLFAQTISATGTITGAQLIGSKLSTTTSNTAFRALIEDDGTYITWMGAGTKTDANGTFWIKKDGTGFISGKLFEGEIIETQVNSFYSSASNFKTVSLTHNSAGKPVEITFRSAITVHIAGNAVSDQSKLRMLVKIKRGSTTLHSESYPPNYVEWLYEPEVSINRTVFAFRDTDFIFDELTTEGARTYTLEVSLTNSGTSGTVTIPSIRGSIKTNENKLASS